MHFIILLSFGLFPAVSFGSSDSKTDPGSQQQLHNTQTDTTCGEVGTATGLLSSAFARISLVWLGINVTLRDPPLSRAGLVRWFS